MTPFVLGFLAGCVATLTVLALAGVLRRGFDAEVDRERRILLDLIAGRRRSPETPFLWPAADKSAPPGAYFNCWFCGQRKFNRDYAAGEAELIAHARACEQRQRPEAPDA